MAKSLIPVYFKCEHCDKLIQFETEAHKSRARYCGRSCVSAAYYIRKQQGLTVPPKWRTEQSDGEYMDVNNQLVWVPKKPVPKSQGV